METNSEQNVCEKRREFSLRGLHRRIMLLQMLSKREHTHRRRVVRVGRATVRFPSLQKNRQDVRRSAAIEIRTLSTLRFFDN